jgi:regulatory protein
MLSRGKFEITSVRRKAGGLHIVSVSSGKDYLVAGRPETKRFLVPGTLLESQDIEELEGPVSKEAGLKLAYRVLTRRERTEKEIRDILSAEGIASSGVIDYIVETLKGRGHLDDRRFATELIEYRIKYKSSGPGLIEKKLLDAGVDREIVDELIRSAFPEGREKHMALELARLRLGRSRNPDRLRDLDHQRDPDLSRGLDHTEGMGLSRGMDRKKAVRRIKGFLSRRGFSVGIVADICAGIMRGDIVTGDSGEITGGDLEEADEE